MQESEGEWGRPPRGQGAKGGQKDEQGVLGATGEVSCCVMCCGLQR